VARTDVVREINLIVIQAVGQFKQKTNKTNKIFQLVAKTMQVLGRLFLGVKAITDAPNGPNGQHKAGFFVGFDPQTAHDHLDAVLVPILLR